MTEARHTWSTRPHRPQHASKRLLSLTIRQFLRPLSQPQNSQPRSRNDSRGGGQSRAAEPAHIDSDSQPRQRFFTTVKSLVSYPASNDLYNCKDRLFRR